MYLIMWKISNSNSSFTVIIRILPICFYFLCKEEKYYRPTKNENINFDLLNNIVCDHQVEI